MPGSILREIQPLGALAAADALHWQEQADAFIDRASLSAFAISPPIQSVWALAFRSQLKSFETSHFERDSIRL